MRPEEQIRLNVQRALGKADKKPVKKQNLFVSGVCKSASRSKSTDLSAVIEACEQLPVSDPMAAALCLICCHNNTQIRQKAIQNAGDDPGAITPEQISLATGEEFSALAFANIITELMAIGVLSIDEEGFYHCTLYTTE